MKKILIITMCLFLMVGCKKQPATNDNTSTTTQPAKTTKYVEPDVLTKLDINRKLYDFGVKMYTSKEYTKYPKVDGKYFISLTKMVSDYNFDDTKMIGPITKKVCDHEKTGVYFDIDNVEKVEYKEYPILIAVYCE